MHVYVCELQINIVNPYLIKLHLGISAGFSIVSTVNNNDNKNNGMPLTHAIVILYLSRKSTFLRAT